MGIEKGMMKNKMVLLEEGMIENMMVLLDCIIDDQNENNQAW